MNSNISQFLEKFRVIFLKEESFYDYVIHLVKDKAGIELAKGSIAIRNHALVLKANPYVKMEILMKKRDILDAIGKTYPMKHIRDIR